jgi:hypothetical protein
LVDKQTDFIFEILTISDEILLRKMQNIIIIPTSDQPEGDDRAKLSRDILRIYLLNRMVTEDLIGFSGTL